MGPWQLAIDFGTTNTAAAILHDGAAVPLRLSSSADQMPSGVLARPDGSLLVGEAAANEAAMYLDSFEPNPKYRLGEEAVWLGGRDWMPVELVGAVLERVGDKARTVAHGAVDRAVVLTHPVAWEQHIRDRLVEAALLAGFRDVTLVSEPVAAARWYSARHRDTPDGRAVIDEGATLGVFDFGGGTCDVAVLRSTDDRAEHFDVLASGGDPYLGGEELDRLVMEWALTEVFDDPDAVERLRADAHAGDGGAQWFTFRDAVRRAKHTLSEADTATVPVSIVGTSRSLRLTREAFDELVAPLLDRAMDLTSRVFAAAGTTPDTLAALPGDTAAMYLTGGSATIPVLQARVRTLLNRVPARLDDPKTVVPRGALVAPRVDSEHVARTVAPTADATTSRLHGELEQRRDAEDRARPGDQEAIRHRIRELERQLEQMREALLDRAGRRPDGETTADRSDRPRPASTSPAPTPASPSDAPRPVPPSQAPSSLPSPSPRHGVVRVLFGMVLGVLGLGSMVIGGIGFYNMAVFQYTDDVPLATVFLVVGFLLVRGARRGFRRRGTR